MGGGAPFILQNCVQHFHYNLNVHSRWIALIQDGRKKHQSAKSEQLVIDLADELCIPITSYGIEAVTDN